MMSAVFLRSHLLKIARNSFKLQRRQGYIVLLPQIPDETPLTNPLLQIEPNPQFKKITAENCFNGVGKLLLDFECNLEDLATQLSDANFKKSFETVIEPIEKLSAPLNHVWSITKILHLVRYAEEMAQSYKILHRRVQKAKTQRFQSLPIFHAVKELHADKAHLSECQQRVVGKYLLESRLNGIELNVNEQTHLTSILRKLSSEKEIFRKKVNEATRRFTFAITDDSVVKNFPSSLLRNISVNSLNPSKGPWNISLLPHVYHEFMKHCSNSELKWNAWLAYMSRASSFNDNTLNTSIHIEEIRFQRRDEAKLLGYKTFAEMSMETKMAGSIETVMSMIATLHKWSKPQAIEELKVLQDFASSRDFKNPLQPWDIPYWRHQQKQELFNLDEDKLRQYFPLPNVMERMFALCSRLFGISIKEATNKVETWDNSVSYYEVFDSNGILMGSFYFDPYVRAKQKVNNIAWIDCGISRSDIADMKPVAFIVMNLYPPVGDVPSLLNIRDMEILFQKFGHCLQHILTTVSSSEVSGLTNIEWDAVDICPYFMAHLMYNEQNLEDMSSHYQSGTHLPKNTIKDLINARNHMCAFDMVQQLYLSTLDLELYSSKEFWKDVMRDVWQRYMILPLVKKDQHPCSFTTIFCDDYSAAYYSHIWAKMIAADIYDAFSNAEDEQNTLNSIGLRFRQTFLAYGGGCHPSEVFRRFQGRDPSPDALLKHCGFKN